MTEQHYARIAELYDAFVKTEVDVPFFINEAKKAQGEVLELMAGTGRLTIPLVEAGIPVTCVDYSAEMLSLLREKLRQRKLMAEVHHMDVRSLQLGKQYRQIIIPFQAFPELTSLEDQERVLQGIHRHLADNGNFICTLHNPNVRLKSVDGQLHLAGRFAHKQNHLFVWLLQKYNPKTKLVDVLEFFEEYDTSGIMCAKRFSELQFRILEKAEFEVMSRNVGFEVAALYGDYAYAPFDDATSPFMIWVLQKAPSR
jgi:ubiquinone/menaquinone biosynthesis C-methylase UbiE